MPSWRRWQADGPAQKRTSYWQDVVCETMLHVTMAPGEPADARPFDGILESCAQADARLVNFRSSAHRITRDARQAGLGNDQYIIVGLQRRGMTSLSQRHGEVRLAYGDIGVIDGTQPFQMQFADTIERCVVLLPRLVLKDRLPRFGGLKAPLRLGADDAVTAILARTVQALTTEHSSFDDGSASVLLSHIADLLALRMTDSAGQPELPGRLAYENLLRIIDRHLGMAGLTPAYAAAQARMSLRTAHRLFRQYSEPRISIEKCIFERRLVRAYQALAQGKARNVSDAAFTAGFADLSHFTRRFGERFGISPSALLPGAGAGPDL
ncbi:MAG TPA: helix-turn-helix domain-containing protein [Bordetella sp.]